MDYIRVFFIFSFRNYLLKSTHNSIVYSAKDSNARNQGGCIQNDIVEAERNICVSNCNEGATLKTNKEIEPFEYGIVYDAGSSGTRARIYRWAKLSSFKDVPDVTEIYFKKLEPGLSDYVDEPDLLKMKILELIEIAKSQIPKELHHSTSVYLMATAGMRLIAYEKADKVIHFLRQLMSDKNICPFKHQASNTRILSGEEEGAFAWISVNQMMGSFNNQTQEFEKSWGVLELGGGSSQITFIPEGPLFANKYPITIGGTEYSLYSRSYLMYGQTATKRWSNEYLVRNRRYRKENTIKHPCMVKGDIVNDTIDEVIYTFIGSGSPLYCSQIVNEFVYNVDSSRCYPQPCAIGPSYQPPFHNDMKFAAISAFVYTAENLGVMKNDANLTPDILMSAAYKWCKEKEVTDILHRGRISEVCHIGLYMATLLTKGYGFDENDDKVRFINDLNGEEINWCRGAIIYETSKRLHFET